MSVVLAEGTAAAADAGAGVQTGVINGVGALVGLVSLVLVAAWWAYLFR